MNTVAHDVVVYGSACPACTQAKGVLDHYGVPYRSELISELPRRHGHPRSMPQITIDDQLLGGINQLLKLARSAACNASPKSRANGGYASDAAWAAATTSKNSTHSDRCNASTTRPTEPKLRRFEISSPPRSVSSIDAPSYAQRRPRVVQ